MTVYEELVTTVGKENGIPFLPKHNESEDAVIARLIDSVSKLSDKSWKSLSTVSQTWFNDSVKLFNSSGKILACPGYQTTIESKIQPEAEKVEQASSAVQTQEATAVPSVENEKKSTKGNGIMKRARQLVLLNKAWDYKQLTEALAKEGFTNISENTVYACWQEVNNVLKAAQEIGLWVTNVGANVR